jgi:hypothetical protein
MANYIASADFETAKSLRKNQATHPRNRLSLARCRIGFIRREVQTTKPARLSTHNPSFVFQNRQYYLQKAKKRIAEIGQWGLIRVIERDFPEGVSQ